MRCTNWISSLALLAPLLFTAISSGAVLPESTRKPAPEPLGKDVLGRTYKLSEFRGKTVLVNFWATWCVPCKVEMPWFNEFDQQYRDRGFVVIGVSLDEEGWQVVTPYLRSTGINYFNVQGDEAVAAAWGGVDSIPQTFLIDTQGRIDATHSGLTDRATFESEIKQLLSNSAGEKPSIAAVVNGASYKPGSSAGMWTTITGANLSRNTRSWASSDFQGGQLPTQLDGVRVAINGKPAFVAYISPSQLNVLSADDRSTGAVIVTVSNGSATSEPFTMNLQPYQPGLFALPYEGGRYVSAHFQDGAYTAPTGMAQGFRSRPAKPGEIITFYGTGFGRSGASDTLITKPTPITANLHVLVGGVPAEVKYAGLISNGLFQFNIAVPAAPEGGQAIVAVVDGVASPAGLHLVIGR